MIDYKDYIKSKADENGTLWHWIETPFFKPSDFNEAIVRNYNHRLKFVTKNELSIENEIEFIKEELTDLQGLIKAKPAYDYEKLSFANRISGDCWFSDETLNEFKRYFKEYYNYKIKEFQADYLKNRLKDLLEPKQPDPNNSNENPYPLIFVGANSDVFDKFKEYTNKHILEPYTDYSYLKKRLENQKLIHRTKDSDFMDFLFKELQLINEKAYNDYSERHESKLKSLSKSYSVQRQNNFNIVFEGLI